MNKLEYEIAKETIEMYTLKRDKVKEFKKVPKTYEVSSKYIRKCDKIET